MTTPKTIRFRTYNPRRNLPPETGRKRGESNFLGAFERHLLSHVYTNGVGGRHFSLPNYGIADFVWLLPIETNFDETGVVLHSFETKLVNWRKAFQQAYRYSYFSDAAFVVLPPESGRAAEDHLALFKEHSIGLWTFDAQTMQLSQIYTPKKSSARSLDAKSKAIQAFGIKGQSLPVF